MRGTLLLLAIVALPGHALAQDEAPVETATPQHEESPPEPANEAEARALFTAGRVAFEQGHFDRALEHFLRAYELSPQPGLLFNIGNAYDRLRQDERAIEYLRGYLDAAPDAENAEFVRSRIEILERNVEERASASRAHAEERERLIEAAHAPADATASDAGIALMIGGGVGLLAMIGPAVWWAGANRAVNECQPRMGCDPRPLLQRQDAAVGLTVTLLVASLLAEAGGILLFAISPRPGGDEAETPSVACGLTAVGASCAGRF